MKKFTLFTLLFALSAQTVAFAAAPKVTIRRELGSSGETVQKVIAEGILEEGEYTVGDQITVRVLPSDKNINNAGVGDYYVIGQTAVEEDGSYYFEKRLPSKTGDTKVFLNTDKAEYKDIYLSIPDVGAIDELVSGLNLGTITSAEAVELIGTDNENLLFDTTVFDYLTNKTAVIDKMKEKLADNFNIENIYNEFDRYTILEALQTGIVDGKTILDNYERVLKLKDRKEYGLFKNLSSNGKTTVYGLVNNNTYEDYNDVYEKYFESVILTSVKEVVSHINIFDILDDYKTELNIVPQVNTLSSSEIIKDTVLIYILKNKANIKSINDLVSYIDYGINNYAAIRASFQQSTPSSGGGGGGGGGSSSYKTDVKLEPENTTPDNVGIKLGLSDISEYPWAEAAIKSLYEQGIVNGKENGKYYPADSVTRAEFVKMITTGIGAYDDSIENAFADTEGHWASKYIASAVKDGYINGISDTQFAPDRNITRQDAVSILYRILVIMFKAPKIDDLTGYSFADDNLIADYARGSVIMMNAYDIVKGYSDNTFKPQKNLTRAEAAVIIDKFLKLQ